MKNIKGICLLQRCTQNPFSPLFPEHPVGWHFPASLKFSYEIWLTQWNVSKSEKHHSQAVPRILPCTSFLFCFVSSNCLGCWWPHSYLRSHIGDGRMSIPLGPWMTIWRRARHRPVHLFCSIIWGKTQKQTNKTKQNPFTLRLNFYTIFIYLLHLGVNPGLVKLKLTEFERPSLWEMNKLKI